MTSNSNSFRIVGESATIQELQTQITKNAASEQCVTILGEAGSGREMVARFIHQSSSRVGRPFVVVNCAAASSSTLEEELFGGISGTAGKIAEAAGGTLFLSEIGYLPILLQDRLLRSIESNEHNARIIASSRHSLSEMADEGDFRRELVSKLSASTVKVPALREHKSDIPSIVAYFIQRTNHYINGSVEIPGSQVMEALNSYDWPENVLELQNLVERIVILKKSGTIELADLPQKVFRKFAEGQNGAGAVSAVDFPHMSLPDRGLDLKNVVTAFENHLVDQALSRTGGNKNRASELLKMNRTTLVEKLRKRGMIKPAAYIAKRNALSSHNNGFDQAK